MVRGSNLSFGRGSSSSTQEEESVKALSEAKRENTLEGTKAQESIGCVVSGNTG
jgi:hypothetical protein